MKYFQANDSRLVALYREGRMLHAFVFPGSDEHQIGFRKSRVFE